MSNFDKRLLYKTGASFPAAHRSVLQSVRLLTHMEDPDDDPVAFWSELREIVERQERAMIARRAIRVVRKGSAA